MEDGEESGSIERGVGAEHGGRHEHPHGTEIIVNGRARTVPGDQVTFAAVVKLAFPDPETDPNAVFSMTYRNADQRPSAGELGPGGTVKVKKGTIFNATRTVKS